MQIPTPNEYAKDHGHNPFPPRWERWLSAARAAILSAQPTAGRHVSVDEHPGKGTVINIDDTSARRPGGGGGGPTGACCIDGECSIVTAAACDDAGGNYLGNGTTCEDIDCTQGACCHVDGTCTIETEAGCDGAYQGDGTVCEDVDCTHTGACCNGVDCTVTREEDCTGDYQGDGTSCDPNPCEELPPCPPCGFDAFDGSGRTFLRYHREITATFNLDEQNECPPPNGFTYNVTAHGSATFEQHYEPDCTPVTDIDSSASDLTETLNGSTLSSCSLSSMECFCNVVIPEHNQCTGFVDYCHSCAANSSSSSETTTATSKITAFDLADNCTIESFVCSPHANSHCERTGSYIVTETLSDECIP